jgi:predicted helicase
MGSAHEVIEAFREAPSNSERGTKFEKLMVRNFELDPMLSQQYAAVRRSIREQGGEPRLKPSSHCSALECQVQPDRFSSRRL